MNAPTKTFRVDAKLRNNLLIKAREALGYKSTAEASRALKLHYPTLVGYEALSILPWHEKSGEWKRSAIAVSDAYRMLPEMLWPDEIGGVKRTRTSIEIDVPAAFLEAPKTPEERLLESGRMETIRNALDLLTPKERQIISSRFDLDGDEPMTRDAIGEVIMNGIGGTRVAQLEFRAFDKLRELIDSDGDPKQDLKKIANDREQEKVQKQIRINAEVAKAAAVEAAKDAKWRLYMQQRYSLDAAEVDQIKKRNESSRKAR